VDSLAEEVDRLPLEPQKLSGAKSRHSQSGHSGSIEWVRVREDLPRLLLGENRLLCTIHLRSMDLRADRALLHQAVVNRNVEHQLEEAIEVSPVLGRQLLGRKLTHEGAHVLGTEIAQQPLAEERGDPLLGDRIPTVAC